MTHRKRICVIGAGPSGLAAIKELAEQGHDVVCYEKYDDIGGGFQARPNVGSVYDSTLLTISNYHMAYSSFPPAPGEGRRYWTHHEYLNYLRAYVRRFELRAKIRFQHVVDRIQPEPSRSGYQVTVTHPEGQRMDRFDKVVVAVGNNHHPYLPSFPGEEHFGGPIVHSASYKNAEPFRDQRVLVVGLGETGADVVHEISQVARHCYLSIRHYPTIIKRWVNGQPNDGFTSRALYCLGRETINYVIENKYLRSWFIHQHLLRSKDPVDQQIGRWAHLTGGIHSQFLTKNDVFIRDLVEGRIELNDTGIARLEPGQVVFQNGETQAVDVVVCCTGYRDRFDFIDAKWRPKDLENVRSMYKHMIHPQLGPDIGFIGFARPASGGFPAVAELQARYLALLYSGERSLPEATTLRRMTAQENSDEENLHFSNTPHLKSLVHWGTYMDGLAELIGCRPRLLHRDLRLTYKMWYGTHLSYQYRLRGPGANAREAKAVLKRLPVCFSPRQIVGLSAIGAAAHVLGRFGWVRMDPKPLKPV